MGITSRAYIVSENGIKRVPRDVLQGLITGQDALPEYAGTTQRAICVILDNEDGKALRIVEAQGSYWVFDDVGHIDDHLREVGGAAMSFAFMNDTRDGKVVSLAPSISRHEFRKEHRWEVTKDILDSIAADIWPAKGLRASDVASVMGKAPKRPPMTSEGKYALAEIERSLGDVAFKLVGLTTAALKGITFHARQAAETDLEHPGLWRGLADQCDLQLEIQHRRRTGKGTWYAIVELFMHEGGHLVRRVHLAQEKCDSRTGAIKAVQRLIIEATSKIGPNISLESRVLTNLEWSPDEE